MFLNKQSQNGHYTAARNVISKRKRNKYQIIQNSCLGNQDGLPIPEFSERRRIKMAAPSMSGKTRRQFILQI